MSASSRSPSSSRAGLSAPYTLLDTAPRPASDEEVDAEAVVRFCAPPPRPPGGRFPWAELIARTFAGALDCYERLLPFSCKGRLCPSCQARRMHDLALHLCERVIPSAPLRQWVLTVPRSLRFPLARDAALWRAVVGITVRTIYR